MNYITRSLKTLAGYPSDEEVLMRQRLITMSKKNAIQMKINYTEKQIRERENTINNMCREFSDERADSYYLQQKIKMQVRPLLLLRAKCAHYYGLLEVLDKSESHLERTDASMSVVKNMDSAVRAGESVYGNMSYISNLVRRNETINASEEVVTDMLDVSNSHDVTDDDVLGYTNQLYLKYGLPIVYISGPRDTVPSYARTQGGGGGGGGGDGGGGGGGGEPMLNTCSTKEEDTIPRAS